MPVPWSVWVLFVMFIVMLSYVCIYIYVIVMFFVVLHSLKSRRPLEMAPPLRRSIASGGSHSVPMLSPSVQIEGWTLHRFAKSSSTWKVETCWKHASDLGGSMLGCAGMWALRPEVWIYLIGSNNWHVPVPLISWYKRWPFGWPATPVSLLNWPIKRTMWSEQLIFSLSLSLCRRRLPNQRNVIYLYTSTLQQVTTWHF